MKRFLLSIAVLLGLAAGASAQSLESLLQSLDAVVAKKESFNRNKEERINAIRSSLAGISKEEDRYQIYDALSGEYAKYNLDSAYKYTLAKTRIAEVSGTERQSNISRLELADICINAGMYQEAEELARSVTEHEVKYYHTLHTLYSALSATTVFRERAEEYARRKEQYRDSLIQGLPANDLGYIYAMAEKLNEGGKYYDAILLLTNQYNDPLTRENDKAILDYCLAVAYKGLNNREKAKWHYTASAIADIRTPVKEYRSLQELAYMLYEDGDLSRAYRYITCAMEDVKASNTLIRTLEFTPFLATISEAYEKDIRHRTRIQSLTMYGLLAVLMMLCVVVGIMLIQRKALRKSNLALTDANQKLKLISSRLKEAGYVKEEYLFQYMEQAAASIDRMEAYRRRILLAYRKYGAEHLAGELEAPLDIDDELRNFYNNFDETFLHLFPTFAEDVNRLLNPEQQLEPKPGRLLNTELRILALIRLGVTDNVKIAHFLRTSLSTVYNYRSKLRNAALSNPAEFETEISKIGELTIEDYA